MIFRLRHACFLVLFIFFQKIFAAPSSLPNLLIIMVDDMGYGDLSVAENPHVKTPRLDQLASESVSFQRFYVSPVCAPTRASLLTGMYHQKVGVYDVTNGNEVIDPQAFTLAEILKEQGYRSSIYGKWHLGEYYPSTPLAQGFDEYLGFRTGHTDQYFDPILEKNDTFQKCDGYITNILTEAALSSFREAKQPLFCYLAYNVPHTPLQIDQKYFQKFIDAGIEERTARVYGMIENLDYNIGRLIDTLETLDQLEQTIIIFLSDNGPISGWKIPQDQMRYNAGLRDQKFTIYEGGIRSQCFWYWKNHWKAAHIKSTFGAHIDIVPTVVDLLNIVTKSPSDGISLLPLLQQGDLNIPRIFYQKYALSTQETAFPGGIVIRDNWKMINGDQLYNLWDDPGEQKNLADLNPEKLHEMTTDYQDWWKQIMADNPFHIKPVLIGDPASPQVFLQPHHAEVTGSLRFEGKRGLLGEKRGFHPSGVDGDWLSDWYSEDASATWEISCQSNGIFQIGIQYANSNQSNPISLTWTAGDYQGSYQLNLEQIVPQWSNLIIDTVSLKSGLQKISLINQTKNDNGLDIRSVILARIDK